MRSDVVAAVSIVATFMVDVRRRLCALQHAGVVDRDELVAVARVLRSTCLVDSRRFVARSKPETWDGICRHRHGSSRGQSWRRNSADSFDRRSSGQER
jgi:hypothetical protein